MADRYEGAAPAAPGTTPPEEAPDPRAPFSAGTGEPPATPAGPAPQQAAAAYATAERHAGTGAPAGPAAPGPGNPAGAVAPAGDPAVASNGEPEHTLERDLDELSAKADKYLELAQRTKADFENYRKRAEKRVGEAQDRGVAQLAKELLPAIDNLDRALAASDAFAAGAPEEPAATVESHLASGIRLVHADVLAALARVGIEPYSPTGEPFDPQYHEAVAQRPVAGAQPGTVVEVFQLGYRLGETVLRPARVMVAA